MSDAAKISTQIGLEYDRLGDAVLISPGALAERVFDAFATGSETPEIAYASRQFIRKMCGQFLARHKDPAAEPTQQERMDFGVGWNGELQDRYPTHTKPGEEGRYILRAHMTPEDRAWNVARLRKAGKSLLEHADALEAEGQTAGAA